MRLFLVALLVTLVGCSSTTSQYYEAVEKAAQANAEASTMFDLRRSSEIAP